MGAFNGTLTYKQYYVEGDLPAGFRDKFLASLNAYAFRDINLDAGEEKMVGWVTVTDILDADFRVDKFIFNQYLCVSLREDAIKVPASTLKVYIQKEETAKKQELKRDKLSKFERDELRDMVKISLRKKTLPTIKSYDVVWNLDARTVWFWTHNRTLCEVFEELFEKTFELRLVPHNTYCALEFAGLPQKVLDRAVELEPADLVTDR
jgi:hypothetical protein